MAVENSARTLWGNENSNGLCFFHRSRHPTLYELLAEIENHSHRSIEHRVSLLISVWTCITGKAHHFQDIGTIFNFIYRESAVTVFSGLWARVSPTYKRGLARALTQCSQMMEKLVEGSAGLCSALVMNIYDPWGDPGLRHLFEDKVVNQKIVNDYVESEPQQLMLIRIECLVKANLDKAAVRLCQWCLKFRHGNTSNNDHDSVNQDSWRWPFLEWLMRLLFRRGQLNDLVAESASCSCHDGVHLIHRVWCLSEAESEALTETLINLFLIRDLLFPSDYCCTKELMKLWCNFQVQKQRSVSEVQDAARKLLVIHASTSAHFYLFVDILWEQYGMSLLPVYLEMYVRGLTSDLNYLEAARQAEAQESVMEMESHMATIYYKLSSLFHTINKEVSRECLLSAFSLEPTRERLELILNLSQQIIEDNARRSKRAKSLSRSSIQAKQSHIENKKENSKVLNINKSPTPFPRSPVSTRDIAVQVGEISSLQFCRPCTRTSTSLPQVAESKQVAEIKGNVLIETKGKSAAENNKKVIAGAEVGNVKSGNAEVSSKGSLSTVTGHKESSKNGDDGKECVGGLSAAVGSKQSADSEVKESSQTSEAVMECCEETDVLVDSKNGTQPSKSEVSAVGGSSNSVQEDKDILQDRKYFPVEEPCISSTIVLINECSTTVSNKECNAIAQANNCDGTQDSKSAISSSTVGCHKEKVHDTKVTKENCEDIDNTQTGNSPSVRVVDGTKPEAIPEGEDKERETVSHPLSNEDNLDTVVSAVCKTENLNGSESLGESCQNSAEVESSKKECSANICAINKVKSPNDSNIELFYANTSGPHKIKNKNYTENNCVSEVGCHDDVDAGKSSDTVKVSNSNHNAYMSSNHDTLGTDSPTNCNSIDPDSTVNCKDLNTTDAQKSDAGSDKENRINLSTDITAVGKMDCTSEEHVSNGLENSAAVTTVQSSGSNEESTVINTFKIPVSLPESKTDENEVASIVNICDGSKISQNAVEESASCKDFPSDIDKKGGECGGTSSSSASDSNFSNMQEHEKNSLSAKDSAKEESSKTEPVAIDEAVEINNSPNRETKNNPVVTNLEQSPKEDGSVKTSAQSTAAVKNLQNKGAPSADEPAHTENTAVIKELSSNEILSKAGPRIDESVSEVISPSKKASPAEPKGSKMISSANEPVMGSSSKLELKNTENCTVTAESSQKDHMPKVQAKSTRNNSLPDHLYLFPHVIIDSNLPNVPSSLLRDFVTVIEGLRNKHLKCTGRWQEIKDICEDYLENVSVLRTMLLQASYYDSVESEMESYSQTSCGRNRQFGSHQSNESIFRDFNADKTAVMKRFVNYPSTAQFQGFVNLSDIHHPRLPLDRLLCLDVLSSHLERPKGHRRHRNREKDPTRNLLRKLRHDADYDREVFKKKRKKKRKEKRGKSHNLHGKKRHSTHKGERAKKKRRRLKKNKESKMDLASGEYFSDLSSTELMNLVKEHSHIFSQDGIANMHCLPNKHQHSPGTLLGESQVVVSEEESNSISGNLKKKKKQVSFEKLTDKKNKLIKGHKHLKHSRSLAKLNELKLARKQSKKKLHGGMSAGHHQQLPFRGQPLEAKTATEQEYPQVVQFSSVKQMQSVQIHQSSVTVDLSGVSGVNKESQNPSYNKKAATTSDIIQTSAQHQIQRCNAEDLMKVQLLMSKQQQQQQQQQPQPSSSVQDTAAFHKDRFQYVQQPSGDPTSASQQSVVKYVCSKMTSHTLSVAQASKCVVVPNPATESLEFDKITNTSLTGKIAHSGNVPAATIAAAVPSSQTDYSKQHVVIGASVVPKNSLSSLTSEVVLSESRSSTPTCTIIPSDYQVSAVPIDLSANAIAYNFKQQHAAGAPQVTALTIPIAQNMQDGSGGKIFAGKLVIPLNNCASVKHPVVAKGIGQIIEATTANIVNSSSPSATQPFSMPGVILVKGGGQSTQIVCAPQQQQTIAIRETRMQPTIRPSTTRPGISSARKSFQKVIIPRAAKKVGQTLAHKSCISNTVSRPKKPVTASCISQASTSNPSKLAFSNAHMNDVNTVTSPSPSTQSQSGNSTNLIAGSSLAAPLLEETASSFGTVISIPASLSALPVPSVESSTTVSVDGNLSSEAHIVTSVATPIAASLSVSTSDHRASTTLASSDDSPGGDNSIPESLAEKPSDTAVLEAADEMQTTVVSNTQEEEVSALTSPLSVADAGSEIQEQMTQSAQEVNDHEEVDSSPAVCGKNMIIKDTNADSEHEMENLPSEIQPQSEAEEEKSASVSASVSCSLAEKEVEPVSETVSLPVKKNIASITRVSHSSQCEKQLQPLARGGIQPTVRAPGIINTQVKVDGTTHSIEVPTRSLTSISEAVRFSLMDMDDATDAVENHVLQSFQTFSQDASSYVNQVSVTFGEGGSIASSSLTATQTTTTDLSSGQSSQAFQAALRRTQSETFSDCHTTVSSTTEWSPNASTSAVGVSQTCGRSLGMHQETDSASESKDEEAPKKKRKKRVKTDKATALELAQKFWCQICDRGFFSAYNLRRHCRNVHKMDFPKGSSDLPFNSPPTLCHAHIPGSCSSTETSPPNTSFAAGQQSVVSPKSPEFHLQSPCRDGKNTEFVLQTSPTISHGHIPQTGQLSNVNLSQDFIIQSPPRIASQKTSQTSPVTPPKEYHIQPSLNVSPGQASQASKISPNSKATQDFSVQSSPCRATQVHQTQKMLQSPMALHSAQCQTSRQLQQGRQIQKSVQSSGISLPLQNACQTQRSQLTTHCDHVQKGKQLNPPLRTDHVQQIVQIPQAHHAVQIQQTGQVHQIKKCSLNQHVSQAGQIHLQQVGQLAQIQQSGKGQVQKLIEVRQTTHGPSQDIVIQSSRNIATGTVAIQGSTAIATAEFFHNQSSNNHQGSANHHSLTQQALASYAAAQLSNASRANIFTQNIQQANPERITCTHSTFSNQNVGEFGTVGNQTYPVSRLSSEASDGLEDLEQFLLENMPWSGEQNTSQNSAHHSSNRPSSADSLTLTIPPQVPHGISLQQKSDSSVAKSKTAYTKPKFKKLSSATISKNSQTSKGSSVKKKTTVKKTKSIHLGLSQNRKECLVPPKIMMDPHKLSPTETSDYAGAQGSASSLQNVTKSLLPSCFTENDSHSSDSVQCIKITHNPMNLKSGPSDSAISFSGVQNLVSIGSGESASVSMLEEKNSLPDKDTTGEGTCKIMPPVADFNDGLSESEKESLTVASDVTDNSLLSLKNQTSESLSGAVQENCESDLVPIDSEAEAINSSTEKLSSNCLEAQNVLKLETTDQMVENSENPSIRDELSDLISKTSGTETYSSLILKSGSDIISDEKDTLPSGEKEALISIPSHEFQKSSSSNIVENSSIGESQMNAGENKPETMLQVEHCTFTSDCQITENCIVQNPESEVNEEGTDIISQVPLSDFTVCNASSYETKVEEDEHSSVVGTSEDQVFLRTEVSQETNHDNGKVALDQCENSFKNETMCSVQEGDGYENRESSPFQHRIQTAHDGLGIDEQTSIQTSAGSVSSMEHLHPVLTSVECKNLVGETENECFQSQTDVLKEPDSDCVPVSDVIGAVDSAVEIEQPFSTINQEALGIIFDSKREALYNEAHQDKINCGDGSLCSNVDGNLHALGGADLSVNKGICFPTDSSCESKGNTAHYVDSSESMNTSQECSTSSQDGLPTAVNKTDGPLSKSAEDCACDTPEESEPSDSLVPRGRSRLRDSKTTSIKRSCPCCDDQTCPPKKCRANSETGFGASATAGMKPTKLSGGGRTLGSNRGKMSAVFKARNVNGPAKNVHTRSTYQRPRTRSSAVTDSTNN